MKISVIIPAYNRESLIAATLDSVARQTHQEIELIIVDNNSTDKTLDIIQDFKKRNTRKGLDIIVLSEPKPGACAARNTGLRHATANWITFFDSDDTMHPQLLENYAQKIEETNGNTDVIVTKSKEIFDDNSSRIIPYFQTNLLAEQILHSFLYTNAYISNKDFFNKCGYWNEDLMGWNDWDFGIRILLQKPRMSYIDKVLINKYTHGDSITGNGYASKLDVWLKSIETAENTIRESNINDKEYHLLLVAYKRLALAGLCKKEKSDKCNALYRQTMDSIKNHPSLKPVFAFLYRYVAWGGHGGSHIADKFIRLILK